MRTIRLFFLLLCLLPALAQAADDLPLWLVNTKFSGDFRYRNEGIDAEGSQARFRNRIRYRLGMETIINDKINVGARFASGAGEARSTNQDLQDDLSAKPIHLDRAYMEVKPCTHWWLTAGKYANPFTATDLHWDADVNFEGGAARWSSGDKTVFSATAAGIWLEPYRGGYGSGIFAGQLAAKGKHGKGDWQIAAGLYSYVNRNMLAYHGGFGNTVSGDSVFATDFEIFDAIVGVTIPVNQSKLTVTVNPLMNTATSKDNLGWAAMLKLKGKCLKRSCSAAYDYRVLEPNAVVGFYTDSDVAGGRTNQRGHRLSADAEVIDGLTLGGTAIFSTLSASGDGNWYQRWMVDASVKF